MSETAEEYRRVVTAIDQFHHQGLPAGDQLLRRFHAACDRLTDTDLRALDVCNEEQGRRLYKAKFGRG